VIERLAIFADREISEHDVLTYAAPNLASGSARSLAKGSIPAISTAAWLSEDWFEAHTSFQDFKDAAEAEFIRRKLMKNQWNVTKTAEEIDIQRSHLYNKIEKYGLQREAK
jgi:two-component system, NtrC family, nitrogen regulation response regulator NtrX